MNENTNFKFTNTVVYVPFFGALLLWVVYWFEIKYGFNLNSWGVYPRNLSGLKGVVFSPFIHGSLEHLYNNTIPFMVLSAALFYFYKPIAWRVLLLGVLLSGISTWIIGRPSFHIGASGLIYVLVSFIFFKGVLTKHFRLIALSLSVVFIYGSMIWYIFPIEEGISWEGHLGGFVTGLLLALIYKTELPEIPKYAWEKDDFNDKDDEFMKHFDEEGNFIPNLPLNEETLNNPEVEIKYHYKKNEDLDN
ncbi:rhomboid family intramembrane serine protease [Croceivirga lutea]|uniref:rhomboid family intramembrane serine protease n=1 Tax=Croceivirga lutea TaxID=1775167 RepID=UPI00163AA911|nr:rhomboid family intramembrane serine protease [Croceivirga lutea]GGG55756.1 rhomboid family intramembrane serine protease [Croceivirga lutea]